MAVMLQRWSGYEASILREATRMSLREFAAYLGVADRTVSKWESSGKALIPRPQCQAILDTALSQASAEVQERFTRLMAATAPDSASTTLPEQPPGPF